MAEVDMGSCKSLSNKPVEIVTYLEKHGSWHQKRVREYIKFGKEIFSISDLLSPPSLKWKNHIIIDLSIKTESIFKSSLLYYIFAR